MAQTDWSDFPQDVTTLLTQLAEMETAMLEKPKSSFKGDDIAGRMERRGLTNHFNLVRVEFPAACGVK